MTRQHKPQNQKLRLALQDAACSHGRLARSVVELAGPLYGIEGLKYDHSSVIRWLDGQQPRSPIPELIAQILSERLGKAVTPQDLGMRRSDLGIDLGLDLPLTWSRGVTSITGLWRADVDRRQFLTGSGFTISAYASAGVRFLTLPAADFLANTSEKRNIGMSDVAALRDITQTYRQLDNRLGGGHLRSTVVQLLDQQVAPTLRTASFTEPVGRQLASAAAELSQMVGWMAFDSEAHGLAQRYLIQALGLARLAGDYALTAEIFAAMSQQAVYVAKADQAIDLARAAGATAKRAGLPILATECHVAEAHGHAARNDARSCARSLSASEHSFSVARSGDESPGWLSYFDEAYLSARIAQCFRDLGDGCQATEYARRSLDMNDAYVRGRAFNLALLCTALVQQGDTDQAVAIGLKATEIAMQLQSYRSVRYILNLRQKLRPMASSGQFQEFIEQAGALARARTELR